MQSQGPCLWRRGGGNCKKGCRAHMRMCVRSLMVRFVLWNACSRRSSMPVAQGKSAQAGMATRCARRGVWNVPCHNSPPAPQNRHARQLTRGKIGPKCPDIPRGGHPAGMVTTTYPHQCRDHARATPALLALRNTDIAGANRRFQRVSRIRVA